MGGAYVMAAPTTKPIGDAFEGEERAMLFKELATRINAWLTRVRSEINESIPTVGGVFEPDQINNKNRLYKAPLSVHSSLDGVVTPLDTENVTYDYTPIEAADGAYGTRRNSGPLGSPPITRTL